MERLLQYIRGLFTFDLRSLALVRVLLGVALLADLEQKSRFIETFYTDAGILPRSALIAFFQLPFTFSVHLASGDLWFQSMLFVIAAVFALLLILGVRTKTVTIVSLLLLISLQNRNMAILNAGDGLLRLLLFWSLFLPMAGRWSLDHALDTGEEKKPSIVHLGGAGWILQIVVIYWVTLLLRQSPEWFSEGSALYYALHLEQLTTSLGQWLGEQNLDILHVLTWLTVGIEFLAPLLLFLPDRRGLMRFLAVILGVGLHLGIFATMHIGVFPFISIIGWLAFLPSRAWDMLGKWEGERPKIRTIWFDGTCGFCEKVTAILQSFLALEGTRRRAAQSADDVWHIMQLQNSWVVEGEDGTRSVGFQGIITVFAASPLFFWCAPLLRWRWMTQIGEHCYRWIAQHRSLLGAFTRPLPWKKMHWQLRPVGLLSLVICFALTLLWNVQAVTKMPLPTYVTNVTYLLRLDQYWSMFAPFPLKDDGWYVVEGTLANGETLNLLHNADTLGVSREKPAHLSTSFPTENWRKYFLNLWLPEFEKYREFYADYHCLRWNRTHQGEKRLSDVNIYFYRENTPPEAARGTEQVEEMHLWAWHCGPKS